MNKDLAYYISIFLILISIFGVVIFGLPALLITLVGGALAMWSIHD